MVIRTGSPIQSTPPPVADTSTAVQPALHNRRQQSREVEPAAHESPWIPSWQSIRTGVESYLVRKELLERLVNVSEWAIGTPSSQTAITNYLWTRYQDQEHREELLLAASMPLLEKFCSVLDTCLDAEYRGRRMRQTCRTFIDAVLFHPTSRIHAEQRLKKWALARHEDRNPAPMWRDEQFKYDDKTLAECINCARRIIRQDEEFVDSLFLPEPEPQSVTSKIGNFFFSTWQRMISGLRKLLNSIGLRRR